MRTEVLKEGQKVLLRYHAVLDRNKIHPKYADYVWVIVKMLDEESGVCKVRPKSEEGKAKVLQE